MSPVMEVVRGEQMWTSWSVTIIAEEKREDLLCPTFSTTFMPWVAHTPPLMLSRPCRVPSDVAEKHTLTSLVTENLKTHVCVALRGSECLESILV